MNGSLFSCFVIFKSFVFLVIIHVPFPCRCVYWKSKLKVLHSLFYTLFVLRHVYHCFAEDLSHILQQFDIEVTLVVYTPSRSTKTGFTSVTVNKVEFSPHDYSSTGFFTFVDHE